jgi:hypothetical protein
MSASTSIQGGPSAPPAQRQPYFVPASVQGILARTAHAWGLLPQARAAADAAGPGAPHVGVTVSSRDCQGLVTHAA